MGGAFITCCCQPQNGCPIAILAVYKHRNGWPVFYTYNRGEFKERYLVKNQSMTYTISPDPLGQSWATSYRLEIDRLNGRMFHTGDNTVGNKAVHDALINEFLWRNAGTYVQNDGENVRTVTLEITKNPQGNVTAFGITEVIAPIAGGTTSTVGISASLENEYLDERLKEDIDDLARRTEVRAGLTTVAAVPDWHIWRLGWNESNVNAQLGASSSALTNGAANIHPENLASFIAWPAPALVSQDLGDINQFQNVAWGGDINQPHFGPCSFEQEPMPFHSPLVDIPIYELQHWVWSFQWQHVYRFKVVDRVCGQFEIADSQSNFLGSLCVLSETINPGDVYMPHHVAASSNNIHIARFGATFTAPGYLAGGAGNCPCVKSLAP